MHNNDCSIQIYSQWLFDKEASCLQLCRHKLKKNTQSCAEVKASWRLIVPAFLSLGLLLGHGISKRDKTLAKPLLSVAGCGKRDILQHREGHCIMQINTQSTNIIRRTHRPPFSTCMSNSHAFGTLTFGQLSKWMKEWVADGVSESTSWEFLLLRLLD